MCSNDKAMDTFRISIQAANTPEMWDLSFSILFHDNPDDHDRGGISLPMRWVGVKTWSIDADERCR